jgi:PIN domain nuclease of toxin-antitoxin system
LSEIGRIEVKNPEFTDAVTQDQRFIVDEVPLLPLIRHGLSLTWTRDPFDRLLVAHSAARRMELCTTDRNIREHYARIVKELRF